MVVVMGQAGSPRRGDGTAAFFEGINGTSSTPPPSSRSLRTPGGAKRPQKLFGSVHQIAGNLAAGMQRIGFQWGIPWGREARSRRERETLPGVTTPTALELDAERRHVASQQILELSEEQILGKCAHMSRYNIVLSYMSCT